MAPLTSTGAFGTLFWNAVVDNHCPARRTRVTNPHCPWLTDDPSLRALKAERDSARDTWLSAYTRGKGRLHQTSQSRQEPPHLE